MADGVGVTDPDDPFGDLRPLREAEEKVLEAARAGKKADFRVGDNKKNNPEKSGPGWGMERTIRGAFLERLLTNERAQRQVHRQGVRVFGGRIDGPVILDYARVPMPVGLEGCYFSQGLDGYSLQIRRLSLRGSVFEKEVGFDYAQVTENFRLDSIRASGGVRMVGARVGGQLVFMGASVSSGDDQRDIALFLQEVDAGTLFFNHLKVLKGGTSLAHARIGVIEDDLVSWEKADWLNLDGLRYERIASFADAATRIPWIKMQRPSFGYYPQPYEQCAKVLREMGHERDARQVLMAKWDCFLERGNPAILRRIWLWISRILVGYGYEPWRVVLPMVLLIALGTYTFGNAFESGVLVPSKERVYLDNCYSQSDPCSGWLDVPREKTSPLRLPPNYPAFNPITYAIDTFFPIVDLHQEDYWLPSESGPGGPFFRGFLWSFIAAGWFLTTVFVAAITGLIKKD